MADENSDRDLFGDPVLATEKGRGRPEHQWTLKNSNKVLLLFAGGRGKPEAAAAIGISVRTLEKHYFRELELRRSASIRLEAERMERLNGLAKDGNVAAEKELGKMLDAARREQFADVLARGRNEKPRTEKLGKKDQRKKQAAEAGGRFAPREGPQQLLN